MVSTITLIILLLGIAGWYFFPQSSTTKINTSTDKTSNDFTVTRAIVNLTRYEPPNKDRDAWKHDNNDSVLGKYEADIGISLTSLYQCPKEAIAIKEYEGSVQGFFGIRRAVTYFLPQLDTALCSKSGSENQYRVYIKWSRRSDTDWTIVVPGYSGTENANKDFLMFVQEITKNSKFDQFKADELKVYSQNIITTDLDSLGNDPRIVSAPKISYDSVEKRLKLLINLEFGNSCSADVDMKLETQTWKYGNTAYIWVNPRPKPKSELGACSEMYSPVKKQTEFYIPLSLEVSSAQILIPDYTKIIGLPVYIKKISF